jgi:putrescine transport system substrate-binding protein
MPIDPADSGPASNLPAMLRRRAASAAFAAGLALFAGSALAQNASPFLPPAPEKPKVVRLLAYSESIDPHALEEFEHISGYAVAYDAYASPESIAEKWREGPYDLVVLPGPSIARGVATGLLAKLDMSRVPNARAIQPAVTAKLAAYDPGAAHSLAFGWAAFGLLYDADKAATHLGGPPTSWGNLLLPNEAGKMSNCGVIWPDARDALFLAAWRLMGVDPARVNLLNVKAAAALLARAKPSIRALGVRDVVGSLARGADCLTAGTAGEAAATNQRSLEGRNAAAVRFANAKEGDPLYLDAFAIPRDAARPDQGYALLNFLLRPDIAARDAQAAGEVNAEAAGREEALKRLWPEGAFDDRIAAAVEAEWTQLRKPKETPPPAKAGAKGHEKPAPKHPSRHGGSNGARLHGALWPPSRKIA